MQKVDDEVNLPFFVSGINAVLIDPSVMRMRNARGLAGKLRLFFFNALYGTR